MLSKQVTSEWTYLLLTRLLMFAWWCIHFCPTVNVEYENSKNQSQVNVGWRSIVNTWDIISLTYIQLHAVHAVAKSFKALAALIYLNQGVYFKEITEELLNR